MIEYALLIVLGFCMGGLVALLIAPTIWRRAVYLTKRRLEATMPMSLSDIEADKDLLRASYAVKVRRLETALAKAREKSAGQLVEVSRLQMEIANLNDQVAMLHKQLDERGNAANVFEKTLKKRFPELEAQLETARAALEERAREIADLTGKLRRSEEAQTLTRQASELQQSEIRQLREGLEKSGVDRTGRFKKRSAQWTLDEFRSEYDRLSLEMSKMREQLALSQKRETSQVVALKSEMQQLAERIMSSATAKEKHLSSQARNPVAPQQVEAANSAAPLRPQHYGEQPLTAPQPWPKDRTQGSATIGHKNPSSSPSSVKMQSQSSAIGVGGHTIPGGNELYGQRKHITPQVNSTTEKDTFDVKALQPKHFSSPVANERGDDGRPQVTAMRTSGRMSIHSPAVSSVEGTQPAATADTRAALKTLLDRTAKPFVKEGKEGAGASFATLFSPVASEPADADAGALPSGPAAIPAGVSLASLAAHTDVADADNAADSRAADVAATSIAPEAQMDKMLREIFEGRSDGNRASSQVTAVASADAVSLAAESPAASASSPSAAQGDASGGASSLADRLRIFQG